MRLVKTSFFSAIITFIRIITGFASGKVVAMFTGTEGVSAIGAFSNFISIALTFANGAINNGVVKYTAEYEGDGDTLKSLFSTSLRISIICSASIGLVLIALGPYFSEWIFTSDLYTGAIRAFGVTIILYSLNSLLLSILNGIRQIKTLTIVNTIGSILSLVFTIVLVYFYKVQGALYAMVLVQSIVFFVTVAFIVKAPWFSLSYFRLPFNRPLAKKLGSFSLMAIISVLTVPVSQIILRNMLTNEIGIDAAGYWQGLMRVSDGYLMIITTALSTYYLPKLSSLRSDDEIRKEIFYGYKIILPVTLLGCIVIYFLRFFIIEVLYTPAFSAMESLFFWQLVGDFFKIASWILAYLMTAKAMTRLFVITEVVFSVTYVALGYLMVSKFNLQGISIAFALNYLIYLVAMLVIFRKLIFK